MKFAKVLPPTIALMALAKGSIPAQAAQKINTGVTMAPFDDVWLTLVQDAMANWAINHMDSTLPSLPARLFYLKT